jgi:hypothetical protein
LETPDLDQFPKRDEPPYKRGIQLLRWWRALISDQDWAWIERMPGILTWDGLCLVHDSQLDRTYPSRWHLASLDAKYQELCHHAQGIHPDMSAQEWGALRTFMLSRDLSTLFCGHTHVPFCQDLGEWVICNVGSAGMPLDGDPRPSWVSCGETPQGERTLRTRRVSYDVEEAIGVVDAADYPSFVHPGRREAYKAMLRTGIHWKAHLV